jgi:hypothetical protein
MLRASSDISLRTAGIEKVRMPQIQLSPCLNSRRPRCLPIAVYALTLRAANDYNFVSGNYCFGGRNGSLYDISSARRTKEEDPRLPYAHEHTRRQKDTQEQKGKG